MLTGNNFEIDNNAPILLRRIEKKPEVVIEEFDKDGIVITSVATHMTVVTTAGAQPEMHDQQEDATRN